MCPQKFSRLRIGVIRGNVTEMVHNFQALVELNDLIAVRGLVVCEVDKRLFHHNIPGFGDIGIKFAVGLEFGLC